MLRGWTSVWHAKEKLTNSERILGSKHVGGPRLLFSSIATRALEASAGLTTPPHTLMQRAGLAVAQFALAVAPHSRVIWIPCGPGNNGGDGYEAARHLKLWGKTPVITCIGNPENLPPDAAASRQRALEGNIVFLDALPNQYDLCIDALFGIGKVRPFDEPCSLCIDRINSSATPVIAIDVPSGLEADTGICPDLHVKASHTLSLLTLKPGLFTADGREACGDIWFNDLGVKKTAESPCAILSGMPSHWRRAHNTHKGTYGDVCIVGGSNGMTGAALLAGRAALHGGAGRVYLALLDATKLHLDISQPELMFRDLSEIAFESLVVVAGCGGGGDIAGHLPRILARSARLVLDADALNAVAKDTHLQDQLAARTPHSTVLTPHPLEAARMMNVTASDVQSNRLGLAQAMAARFSCTVVLKGSGTVIAAPGQLPQINPTGNAKLASAGTGDVLAGLIGARLAAEGHPFQSACEAVFQHGNVADEWDSLTTITAQNVAIAL